MNELDSFTSEYLPNAPTHLENDLILNWYPKRIVSRLKPGGSLLELGLGHGITASIFNKHVDKHVIIEGSRVVIDLFKKHKEKIPAIIVEGYFETFETVELFDCIVMGFVLEHVDDPGFLLDHYKKFLKPDGVMNITVPNAKSLNRRLGLELGIIGDIYSLNEHDLSQGHKRQFCLKTLRDLVTGHGYKISHEEGLYLKPLPLSTLKTLPDFKANLDAMLKVGIDFPDLCVGLFLEVKPA